MGKMRMPNFQKDPVFSSLKRMLHETVRSGVMVTVVHWATAPSIEVPYTSDLALIDRALDRISADSTGAERDRVTEVEEDRDRTVKAIVEHATATGSEKDLDPNDEMANLEIRSDAQFALWEMQQKVAAMNAVISA